MGGQEKTPVIDKAPGQGRFQPDPWRAREGPALSGATAGWIYLVAEQARQVRAKATPALGRSSRAVSTSESGIHSGFCSTCGYHTETAGPWLQGIGGDPQRRTRVDGEAMRRKALKAKTTVWAALASAPAHCLPVCRIKPAKGGSIVCQRRRAAGAGRSRIQNGGDDGSDG